MLGTFPKLTLLVKDIIVKNGLNDVIKVVIYQNIMILTLCDEFNLVLFSTVPSWNLVYERN